MHRFAFAYLIASRRGARLLAATLVLLLCANAKALEAQATVWIVSNGFHTSFAFRSRDLPFGRCVANDKEAQYLLIGWGAGDFYRGKVNPWTFLEALLGIGPSLLHVVPVCGRIGSRFSHSDIVSLSMPVSRLKTLAAEVDRAFTRRQDGSRVFEGRGYYLDSRFYLAREHFYFPHMCNTWVALKLRRSGFPIFIPTAIVAEDLIDQAARLGTVIQHRSRPADGF